MPLRDQEVLQTNDPRGEHKHQPPEQKTVREMENQRKQNISLFELSNHTLQYRPLAEFLLCGALVFKGATLGYLA